MPLLLNITGVITSQALADILTCLFSLPFFIAYIKEINNKIKNENEQAIMDY